MSHRGCFRESDLLRKVFKEVVCVCIMAGLGGGERFALKPKHVASDLAYGTGEKLGSLVV